MPADAEASEAIDLTLAEPVPATAALGSVHDVRRVQSESEVPEVCTVTYMLQPCNASCALPYGTFADLCRSPPQRAAVPQICLHMRRDPNASNPRMRGWILRSRLPLTAINMI